MSKFDPILGKAVREHLISKGVETPMVEYGGEGTGGLAPEQQITVIEDHFKQIMRVLNLDLRDDSLADTPKRVAKMYVNEIFSGLSYHTFPKCTAVENKMGYDEMVIEKDITCISACEHHFVTIDQICHIAYVPNKKVLGLSKLNRIAKYFAQRPQIQERFVEQVYHALQYILQTDNIAVVAEGRHYCVAQRGVEDQTSRTITSKLGGGFKTDPALRAEFMSLIR
jgi:GTP cyclohydrolase I